MTTVNTNVGSYQFQSCDPSAKWNDTAGVYLFVKENLFGPTTVLYAGMTMSFSQRMPNHERWDEARRLGATGILAMACSLVTASSLELELIQAFDPPMNVHHRTPLWQSA